MKRLSFYMTFILSVVLITNTVWAQYDEELTSRVAPDAINYEMFSTVPMLDNGRVKPVDTFARSQLITFSHKNKYQGKEAIEWFFHMLIDPQWAYQQKVVKEQNFKVISSLKMERDDDHLYSFQDLALSMRILEESIMQMAQLDRGDLQLEEKRLLELYEKTMYFYSLSRSFTCFIPDITVENEQLLEQLNLKPGEYVNYFYFIKNKGILFELLKDFDKKAGEELNEYDAALVQLVSILHAKMKDQVSSALRIVPPASGEEWDSPWTLMDGRKLTNDQILALDKLEAIVLAAYGKDQAAFDNAVLAYDKFIDTDAQILLEIHYNQEDYFLKSFVYSIISLVIVVLVWLAYSLSKSSWLWIGLLGISSIALLASFVVQTVGIWLRMDIMNRPPVTTLYESIIFVAWVVLLLGIIVEVMIGIFAKMKGRFMYNGVGIFVAALGALLLNVVGFRYELDGDTMGMLIAVLNSKFWLTTHVLTITFGYGVAVLVGILAFVYLVARLILALRGIKKSESLTTLFKIMHWFTIIALFFTTLGTILGGIWADQSWGRFWGWDPKENGAMLIVLWLLAAIHGRIAGYLKEISYSVSLIWGIITVLLAWYGVNLLSVGLHSYGFSDNAATALFWSCTAIFFIGLFLGIAVDKFKPKKKTA